MSLILKVPRSAKSSNPAQHDSPHLNALQTYAPAVANRAEVQIDFQDSRLPGATLATATDTVRLDRPGRAATPA